MKKIGSGWTYNVYEYPENKVLKKKKSFLGRCFRIIKSDPREIFKIKKTIHKLDMEDRNSFVIIEKLRATNFNFNKIGNPILLHESSYQQDKVRPVYLFLKDSQTMKNIIDKYIQQIQYFWGYGFADTVYNFTINNALDDNEDIVLIDFNEITNDRDKVLDSISKKVWNNRFSVKQHLNKKDQEYFKQKMDQEITQESLSDFWKKSL